MGRTPYTGLKFSPRALAGAGIVGACLASLIPIWSGLESATKQPEEGRAMGRSATATAARPPIDLAAPAMVRTATFALG